ncbi:MAG: hypothetical protein K0M48_05515 [Thiobacillus sp.]|nr:hypothetical protein [Thiobacillus sp.]
MTPTAIHAHCLLLYFSAYWPETAGSAVRYLVQAMLLYLPTFIHLAAMLIPPGFSSTPEKTSHSARQDGICIGNAAQHRLGVRVEIR